MKRPFLLAFCFIFTQAIHAQVKLNLGIDAAVPMGYLADYTGFGTGAMAKIVVPAADDRINICPSIGYQHYFPSNISSGVTANIWLLPVKCGVYYNFLNKLYVGADLGYYYWKTKANDVENISWQGFGFAPTVGYKFVLKNANAINVNLRYETSFVKNINYPEHFSLIGLNIGYEFAIENK